MIGNQWDPGDPPSIVGEPVAGRTAASQALRKRIRELAADLHQNTFDLAEALFQAQENHSYLEWGFESLPEYAELELGIKPRKAQYLARIVRVCRECGVARVDYEPAEITKLRVITTLDTKSTYFNREKKEHEPMVEHIVDLIAEAPELTTKEVEEKVLHLKGMDGDNAPFTRSYTTTRSAYENTFERFFEAMRRKLGSKGRDGTGKAVEYSDGTCLEYGLVDWLNDPSNFMEEVDCSKDQIEIPLEETNGNHEGTATTSMDVCQEG